MAGRVAGKKAFITGGAQGLGAAMARKLAAEGAKVSIADINHDGAKVLAAEIDATHGTGTAFAFPLDVTKEDQWIFALEEADAAMGGISVLVNNAGISRGGDIEQLSFEDWKLVMSVNVDSVFLGTKHALKYMRANQPGSIINISSIAGLIARAQLAGLQRLQGRGLAAQQGDRPALRQAGAGHPLELHPPHLPRHPDPGPAAPAVRQGGGGGQARPPDPPWPYRRAGRCG